MTTIRTTQTTTTTTVTNDLPNPAQATQVAAQLAQAINQLGQVLTAATQQTGAALPKDGMMQAQSQAPVNLSGGAAPGGMDVYKAASALDKHFAVAEGIGTNGKGKGSGDGNIGLGELKNLANPASGAPPELQQAAKFLLEHPAMAKVIDGAKGKGGEVHINRADLQKLMAGAPAGSGAMPTASNNLAPMMSSAMASLLGSSPIGGGSPTSAPTTAMSPATASGTFSSPTQGAPMDVYGAAQALKSHFGVAEGIGTNGKGKGSGDGNIGLGELKQLANPANGAPAQLQQAAQFLLAHPAMAKVIDGAKGKGGDVHINMNDLNKLLANAPAGSGAGPSAAQSQLQNLLGNAPAPTANAQSQLQNLQNMAQTMSSAMASLLGSSPIAGSAPMQQPMGMQQPGATGGMDVYKAASALDKHFAVAEGIGMNGKGKGSGDGNIGLSELKNLANPKSGAPAELQQAAQFLLAHPAMAKVIDGAKGKGGDVHINRADLQKMMANAPAGNQGTPMMANAPASPQGGNSLMGIFNQAAGLPSAPTTAMSPATASGTFSSPTQAKPMDVYGAAQELKNHFAVAEGIGMNGKGKGSGDGNIGASELRQLANPANGAPPRLQQAAQFMLAHPSMARVIDGGKGKGGDVHINMADLNKILASAPGGSGGTQGVAGTSSKDIIMEQVKATAFKMNIS
ncbi:hypothetical protein D187_005271 [Cystobacter fuscus DSM 2262]|uniref:Uncharacterized protein n=1 Tax=Cystobacter fuscus (strain ATCC 25194 / DSM 2262 / NBRC 100088 / M29) TaxID=1242864 RepID=S9PNW7_CYSF2|nr:hypothetical protein [Cystobacter fuscus]EPX64137.1 hypothetical protein D187_005271 [Cystobacter fuscus DSM 2262]